LDRDLRFLRINERLAEINGIPAADHIGKTVRELLPGLADAAEPGMRRVLETGEPRLNIEIVSEMPDSKGAQRSWLEQWLPIKDSEGRVTGLNIVVEEITDRKQAEEKLAWLASFPGLNPNPIAEIDLAGGEVKYANPTAERLFPDLARLGIAHPLLAGAQEQANAVRTKGEPVVREVAVGDTWYLETLSLTPDRQRLRVYGLDITERKSAEEALGESEARYRLIFETANEGIWVTDGERRTVLVNQRMADMLGYSVDELLGRFPAEFLCAGQEPVALKTRQELSAGETTHYEFKFRRKDGSDLWVISSASPVRDREGRLISTISMLTDITERQKTEALRQALAEQDRARLGAAVEQASDSVVIFDLDGKIRYVNAAFESVNQLSRERAVGHSYFDLLAGDPSAAALRTAIGQGLAWHGPISRAIPDGRTIELEVMYSPARDPAGTIIGGLVTARDVTRVNALQEQVRQAQKMEALGTLAGGITHDFNNILGTIVINTELALLDLDPSDPARRPLPVVLQAANRGKELVKQIITFSRQRAWERKPVDIAPVVREGLGLLRSTLPKDILLRETIGDACGVVLADPSHIHQILVNLCQNAALAMRDGGERQLDVELGPVEVDAAMAIRNPDLKPGPYVRLTVADTGCGMTPETMERIFEPFFTTRERGSGSGLGLSVVHGIVKSYGGAIAVRSRSGQGSVFNIYLPRLGEDVQAARTGPAPQPARGQARILVVEDEEAQRTSLARGLERLGYGVAAEPDGRSALAAFRKDPDAFDLVITDQIMPRMSGLELAAELTKVRPGVPVILCTGFSENVNDGTVGTSGIRELAMKPFTITEISQLVRKVLEKEKVRP
jgi:PAS domain S-box-containing protein